MMKFHAGVIGVGYLGQFHAEKYAKLDGVELTGVLDPDRNRAQQVAEKLSTRVFADTKDMIGNVELVSIVAPTVLHHRIAREFLLAGTHVLLEKPVTTTLEEADELIEIASKKKLVLQVGHIERFNPAIRTIKPLLKSPRYMQAERSAPFTVRCTDVNVVLDLMIHDLDILCDLAGSRPLKVSAAGVSVITKLIDTATARIIFENGCIADVTASRVSDEKKRLLKVFDGDLLYTADYQTQKAFLSEPSRGESTTFPARELPSEKRDTLFDEISDFVECVRVGKQPLVSGKEGRNALALARLITTAIEQGNSDFTSL
ncbi:MAG: Gfo/Idh/MocA family oxidoreductase [Nitrospirota bacterium]|nr:Gfo/Idh/MocA family oxidoreductase [Nitrospirota bacterium]